jgi:hypothetical protein
MLPVIGAVSEPTFSVDCDGGAVTHFLGEGVLAIFVAAAARARESPSRSNPRPAGTNPFTHRS